MEAIHSKTCVFKHQNSRNRRLRFGKEKKPMWRKCNKLYTIEPDATVLHAVANITPWWKMI
jgi:hypothetical protein